MPKLSTARTAISFVFTTISWVWFCSTKAIDLLNLPADGSEALKALENANFIIPLVLALVSSTTLVVSIFWPHNFQILKSLMANAAPKEDNPHYRVRNVKNARIYNNDARGSGRSLIDIEGSDDFESFGNRLGDKKR